MSDKIKVSPTPVQRNSADVAMELLNIHLRNVTVFKIEDLGELYSKYYSIAKTLENTHYSKLDEFIPKEILNKLIR